MSDHLVVGDVVARLLWIVKADVDHQIGSRSLAEWRGECGSGSENGLTFR
jgi:hypothetical protein